MHKNDVGRHGEEIAVRHLVQHGFDIVGRNIHMRIGEIDIVAKRQDVYHFVEVKTRLGDSFERAGFSLTHKKLKHLKMAVEAYMKKYELFDCDISVDFVAIDIGANGEISIDWNYNISI